MKILRRLSVPTGDILVVEGSNGKLEMLSLGDYGQNINLNQHKSVPNGLPLLPLTEKWVITISTQYGCSMGCTFCSPAGTKVNTPNGKVNIEDIKIGDYVIGFDDVKEKPIINQIEALIERDYDGDLICINLDNGKILKLTPEHEVFTRNGLKQAQYLTEKDELIQF